jgi:hypothetical protein
VADAPDGIVLRRHRDLEGRRWQVYVRRGLLAVVTLFLVAGLFNAFGQRPSGATASARGATLKVYGPTRVRGGLMFEARFTITAEREIRDAQLVLSQGWLEGMTINTIEPSPVGEASKNGKLSLDLGHIPAGQSYILFMQFQVNATNLAWHRSLDVRLFDGKTRLLTVDRRLTVYP